MTPSTDSVIRRVEEWLDAPDCGCKSKKQQLCITLERPCAERIRSGSCNCDPIGVPLCALNGSPCEDDYEFGGCKCKIVAIASCIASGSPCASRGLTGRCDCPYLPGPPCEHILAKAENARLMKISLDEYDKILCAAKADEYAGRPTPPPKKLFTRAMRVSAYARRESAGLSTFNPLDDKRTSDRTGLRETRSKNGRGIDQAIQRSHDD